MRMEDVIPLKKRSIRHIPLPTRNEARKKSEISVAPEEGGDGGKKSGGRKMAIWIVAFIFIVGLIMVASTYFAVADVTIVPREVRVPVNVEMSATPSSSDGDVFYKPISIEKTYSKEVLATGEEHVEKKASGKITIYNNWSTSSQRLIKNTRFETAEGLIFRIAESVNVPGQKISGGSVTPGSVEAVVYADAPGPRYNIGPSAFTIPGFKSDSARYSGLTARSSTSMSGGFVGNMKKVEKAELNMAVAELKQLSMDDAYESFKAQVPENLVVTRGAIFSVYSDEPAVSSTGDKTLVTITASSTVYVFDRQALSVYLAQKVFTSYNGEPIVVGNFDELSFAQKTETLSGKAPVANRIVFAVTGEADFIWQFDAPAISEQLAGKQLKNINSVLSKFESVKTAEASIKPFWKRIFPKSPDKIRVKSVLDDKS